MQFKRQRLSQPVRWLLLCGVTSVAIAIFTGTRLADVSTITHWIHQSGPFGSIVFVAAYVVATLLVLPSTAFNLAAGAFFGPLKGLFLATLGALISAIIAFALTRVLGKRYIRRHLSDRWANLDQQLEMGGLGYVFALRLFPLIPYGIVSFAVGLSRMRKREYLIGSWLGTPLGLIPFVLLGSSGVQAVAKRDLVPLVLSFTLLAAFIRSQSAGNLPHCRFIETRLAHL
jgi:uncharacterized membrane protein YdjX (TVP38/TMEM64 family)